MKSSIMQDIKSKKEKEEALKGIADALKNGLNKETPSIIARNIIKYTRIYIKEITKSIIIQS